MAISQGSLIQASDFSNMCRIATGSFVGTGGNVTITCPFTPLVVLITRGGSVGGHFLFIRGQTTDITSIGSNGPTGTIAWGSNSLSITVPFTSGITWSWAAWG